MTLIDIIYTYSLIVTSIVTKRRNIIARYSAIFLKKKLTVINEYRG